MLIRAANNTTPADVPPIRSGDVGLPSIPDELRKKVAANPTLQQMQVVPVSHEQTGQAVSAVIVGSRWRYRGPATTGCTSSTR